MSRNISIDILKLLLAIAIMGIHLGGNNSNNYLLQHLATQGFFRLAVPIFFVINGYFIYTAIQQNKFSTWVKKLILLYITWMIVYTPLWINSSETILKNITFGYFHLWYLPGAIGGALLIRATEKTKTYQRLIALFLCLAIGVAIQYLSNYNTNSNSEIGKLLSLEELHRNFIFMGFPFMYIGYLINQHSQKINRFPMSKIFIFATIGATLLALESYLNFKFSEIKKFDILITITSLAPLLFILALKTKIHSNTKNISNYSAAIYFTHPMCMFIASLAFNTKEITYILLTISLVFIFSFLTVKLNKKFNIFL